MIHSLFYIQSLTVGGGAALMRVVEVAADIERALRRGATGVMNAVAADAQRARNARAEKRAIFSVSLVYAFEESAPKYSRSAVRR